jgi:phage tail-like protein
LSTNRYIGFNNGEAFAQCRLDALVYAGGLVLKEGATRGTLITPVLDSLKPHNLWQRCLSICDIPVDGRMTWKLYATDDEQVAEELDHLIADSRLSVHDVLARLENYETHKAVDVRDFLLQNIKAQYLVCSVELLCQGLVSPCLRSLQLFYAWEGALDYLPSIYQEEGGFLDRFTRLLFAQYLDVEHDIEQASFSFDPRVASVKDIRWLAAVIGTPHINLWPIERLREVLIKRTYTRKGTAAGLTELLEIFTGIRPYLVERFKMRGSDGRFDSLYADAAIHIFFPPGANQHLPPTEAIHLVARSFLPEQVSYKLHVLHEGARVGDYSYLGVNTHLVERASAVLGHNVKVGYSEVGD